MSDTSHAAPPAAQPPAPAGNNGSKPNPLLLVTACMAIGALIGMLLSFGVRSPLPLFLGALLGLLIGAIAGLVSNSGGTSPKGTEAPTPPPPPAQTPAPHAPEPGHAPEPSHAPAPVATTQEDPEVARLKQQLKSAQDALQVSQEGLETAKDDIQKLQRQVQRKQDQGQGQDQGSRPQGTSTRSGGGKPRPKADPPAADPPDEDPEYERLKDRVWRLEQQKRWSNLTPQALHDNHDEIVYLTPKIDKYKDLVGRVKVLSERLAAELQVATDKLRKEYGTQYHGSLPNVRKQAFVDEAKLLLEVANEMKQQSVVESLTIMIGKVEPKIKTA